MINKPEQIGNITKHLNHIAEPKFDGIRCFLQNINGKTSLIRDDGNIKTAQFPEIINSVMLPDNTILDGEICLLKNEYSADFHTLLKRQTSDPKKIKLLSESIPCTFMAFDIMQLDGSNTTKDTIECRYSMLNEVKDDNNSKWLSNSLAGKGKPVNANSFKIIQQYEPEKLFPLIEQYGMEGIVLKPKGSTYNQVWRKYKNLKERDFEVTGYTKSETKSICAFNLIDENGQDMGKVSNTKFKQTTENENLLNEKLKTKGNLIAVVQYLPMPKGKLRFPVLKELRIK